MTCSGDIGSSSLDGCITIFFRVLGRSYDDTFRAKTISTIAIKPQTFTILATERERDRERERAMERNLKGCHEQGLRDTVFYSNNPFPFFGFLF